MNPDEVMVMLLMADAAALVLAALGIAVYRKIK